MDENTYKKDPTHKRFKTLKVSLEMQEALAEHGKTVADLLPKDWRIGAVNETQEFDSACTLYRIHATDFGIVPEGEQAGEITIDVRCEDGNLKVVGYDTDPFPFEEVDTLATINKRLHRIERQLQRLLELQLREPPLLEMPEPTPEDIEKLRELASKATSFSFHLPGSESSAPWYEGGKGVKVEQGDRLITITRTDEA